MESGKRSILFKRPQEVKYYNEELSIQCGQCIGCRLEYSRQWAMRCMDEASLYENNSFITLTYDDKHLPKGGSLEKRDFQLFMKKLRKDIYAKDIISGPVPDEKKVRYFHAGEYGETNGRPHYHACLFNYRFDDLVLYTVNRNGDKLYNSKTLEALWPQGMSIVGDVTFESAAYVARYVLKKYTGKQSDDHYLNKQTGEILPKEYTTMSRRPGIGLNWYNKFKDDVFPSDFKVVRGKKMRVPKFYEKRYELDNPEEYGILKQRRIKNVKREDNTLSRLAVKEEVKMSKIKNFVREI